MAVLKNPDTLTGTQQVTMASIKVTKGPLYRSYLINEQLRAVFAEKGQRGRELLTAVIAWAARSGIPEMADLARTLHHRLKDLILNTLEHGVSKARAEPTNTHINGLIRRPYGFHSPDALIAMIELTSGYPTERNDHDLNPRNRQKSQF